MFMTTVLRERAIQRKEVHMRLMKPFVAIADRLLRAVRPCFGAGLPPFEETLQQAPPAVVVRPQHDDLAAWDVAAEDEDLKIKPLEEDDDTVSVATTPQWWDTEDEEEEDMNDVDEEEENVTDMDEEVEEDDMDEEEDDQMDVGFAATPTPSLPPGGLSPGLRAFMGLETPICMHI